MTKIKLMKITVENLMERPGEDSPLMDQMETTHHQGGRLHAFRFRCVAVDTGGRQYDFRADTPLEIVQQSTSPGETLANYIRKVASEMIEELAAREVVA